MQNRKQGRFDLVEPDIGALDSTIRTRVNSNVLTQIDLAIANTNSNRSEFIREAINAKLRLEACSS